MIIYVDHIQITCQDINDNGYIHKHFPVVSSFMTYHRVCNYINTTDVPSGEGTANPSGAHDFTPGF